MTCNMSVVGIIRVKWDFLGADLRFLRKIFFVQVFAEEVNGIGELLMYCLSFIKSRIETQKNFAFNAMS